MKTRPASAFLDGPGGGGRWRRALLALALGCAACAASEKGSGTAAAEQEKIKLPEAEEKALREVVDKLVELKRQSYTEDMQAVLDALAAETGVDAQGRARIEQKVDAAVEAAMQGWGEKARDWLAPYVSRSGRNALREMARWPLPQIAKSPGVENVVPPEEQAVWQEHLRQVLNEAQWKAWQTKLERDEQEKKNRLQEHVTVAAENQRMVMAGELDLLVADIVNTLQLPPGRAGALKELAEKAMSAAVETWKEKAVESLLKMDRGRRDAVIMQGGGHLQVPEMQPHTHAVWQEGLAALLDDGERARLESARAQRQERRIEAVQHAILQILDERAGLTADQVQALLPLLKPVAEKQVEQMKRYYNLDPHVVAAVLRDTDLKDVMRELEPDQRAELKRMLEQPRRGEAEEERQRLAAELPPPATEEELEALLTEDMIRRHRQVWDEMMARMKAHIDDLHRQTGLTPEQRGELSLTAAGAVQDSLLLIRQQLGSWLRQSLANVPVEAVRQRLATLGTAGFGGELDPKNTPLWQAALQRVLDADQKQRWREVQDQREATLRRTQQMLVVSELQQQLALTPEQTAFFDGQIGRVLAQYATDLDSNAGARRWHLHAYSMLTPVMGVPEEELKKQLTAEQMLLWQEKAASQVRHYWEGVKRKHDSRIKSAESGKSKEVRQTP